MGSITIFIVYMTLMINVIIISGHPHHSSSRQRNHHHHHHHNQQNLQDDESDSLITSSNNINSNNQNEEPILSRRRQSSNDNINKFNKNKNKHVDPTDYDNYDEDDDEGPHTYLMRSDNHQSSSSTNDNEDSSINKHGADGAQLDEDKTLMNAFEKHMRLGNKDFKSTHDVYAYQLPSNLWFIVRYAKTSEGQVEKYMNIVDSFTNYLDKLDHDVKTVSVNVKGVETVFRLTSKPKH